MEDLIFKVGNTEVYWQSKGWYFAYTESYKAVNELLTYREVSLSGTYRQGSFSSKPTGWSLTFPVKQLSKVLRVLKKYVKKGDFPREEILNLTKADQKPEVKG